MRQEQQTAREGLTGLVWKRHLLGGTAGNSRLTALTGIALLVLLAVEGATLLSLQSFLSWHIFVGMLLVPVVGLKLASTGYRFARYYSKRAAYVRAGPPTLLLRLLGPVVVASTLGLFASGVALVVLGPGTQLLLGLHKASFVVWVGAMSLHVLAHVSKVGSLAAGELRGDVQGTRLRVGLVAAVVVAGAIFAVATFPLASPWIHWIHSG